MYKKSLIGWKDLSLSLNSVPKPCDFLTEESYLLRETIFIDWLRIGQDIKLLCPDASEFDKLLQLSNNKYIINTMHSRKNLNIVVHINFMLDADGHDVLLGMLHCYLLRSKLSSRNFDTLHSREDFYKVIAETGKDSSAIFPNLLQQMKLSGWNVDSDSILVETGKRIKIETVKDAMHS